MATTKHIGPRVNRRGGTAKEKEKESAPHHHQDLDRLVETTRVRLDNLLSTLSNDNDVVTDKKTPQEKGLEETKQPATDDDDKSSNKPRGILKTPRYSSRQHRQQATGGTAMDNEDALESITTAQTKERNESVSVAASQPPMVKDVVVERQPQTASLAASSSDAIAVEGYITAPSDKDKEDPLVLSSMTELLDAAGAPTKDDTDLSSAQVVEANLSFSVMAPNDYREHQQEQGRSDGDNNAGDPDNCNACMLDDSQAAFNSNSVLATSDDEESYNSDDEMVDIHDNPIMDDEDYVEESMPSPEPRAFMQLWSALSHWITPEAVALLQAWKRGSNPPSPPCIPNDIQASTCAGVMAMVNMNLPRALRELNLPTTELAPMRLKLSALLQCFHYSRYQTSSLNHYMMRCMTCILVDIVLIYTTTQEESDDTNKQVPASAAAVGLKLEEYRYLTRSAIASLVQGSG